MIKIEKQIFKINENGHMQFGCDTFIEYTEEIPEGYTDIPLPCDDEGKQLPFYRPKWTGTEWVEDMSQEEIDALNNQPRPVTQEQRISDLELLVLQLGGVI